MDWTAAARRQLDELRGAAPGWAYRAKQAPGVEPTVLASLGMLAADPQPQNPAGRERARIAGDWLAKLQAQTPDGSVGISEALPLPPWPTAHALLLWGALDRLGDQPPRYVRQRNAAVAFLLKFQGQPVPLDPRSPLGHDSTIPGWPWVPNTHMWVEPTAWAILALAAEGQGQHARVAEGRRLLRNRSLPAGGWNYGNTVVLGTELRPHPGPSGIGLLGLHGDAGDAEPVALGVKYLQKTLPTLRAAPSLAPGLIALASRGATPKEAPQWLAEAHPPAAKRSDAAYQLAWLLLAARPETTLKLLGAAK